MVKYAESNTPAHQDPDTVTGLYTKAIKLDGTVSTGDGQSKFTVPVKSYVEQVEVYAGSAPTGSSLDYNIQNGTDDVFSSVESIADGDNYNKGEPDQNRVVSSGTEISLDVDQVGSSTAGDNLLVQVTLGQMKDQ